MLQHVLKINVFRVVGIFTIINIIMSINLNFAIVSDCTTI